MVHTSFSGRVAETSGRVATVRPGPDRSPPEPRVAAFGVDALAKMSHQLRSPLAGITGLTRIMLVKARKGPLDSVKLVQQLEMIQASAHRSMATVERVLDAAKLELAMATAEFVPVELGGLLAEVAGATRGVTERGTPVRCADIPRQPVMVTTSPDLLSRLLGELIDNALTFADTSEVRVGLSTCADPDRIAIEVSDDGAGIADKDQARIFEAFERGDDAAQLDPEGIGMGLYLARKMAERLGADLSVSSHLGSGSTFTVTLGDPAGLAALRFRPQRAG